MKRCLTAGLLVLLFLNLQLHAGTFSFSAASMSGSMVKGQERTILNGQASINADGLVITADRIEMYGNDFRFAECSGNVLIIDDAKGLKLSTSTLFYDRELKVSRLTGPSVMEDYQNNLVIKGEFIENDDTREIVLIQINVRIIKDDLVCRSEFARYNRQSKILELTGAPTVIKGADNYSATRITVNIDTEDIKLEGRVAGTVVQAAKATETAEETAVAPTAAATTDAATVATDTVETPSEGGDDE
ncbi:MAG: hypothetical protein KKI09_09755 [Spirochaetes bacterium]|nr:hypothetical protein [Spirochaetota bacterium]MBU0955699.1 hypothetical protein [Spirochaetota bacterium]